MSALSIAGSVHTSEINFKINLEVLIFFHDIVNTNAYFHIIPAQTSLSYRKIITG